MYPTLTDASLCRLAKLGGDPFELEVLYAVASLSQSCCWNTQRGVGGWGGSLNPLAQPAIAGSFIVHTLWRHSAGRIAAVLSAD